MSYNLTSGHAEKLTSDQGHDLIGKGHAAHKYRSVLTAWTHLKRFNRSSLSLSKGITEKLLGAFHDLRWPREKEEGLYFLSFQGVKFTYILTFESFNNIFYLKEATFNFLPSAYNGAVAKLI